MFKMLKLLFLAVFIPAGLGAPPPPPPGGLFGDNIEDQENAQDIKDAALQACIIALQEEFRICPPGSRCNTRISRIENFRTQVVAGTNYFLDLTLTYDGREFVCREITVHEPLANQCFASPCLDSINEDDIIVNEVFSPLPPLPPLPCAGCAEEANINDQPNKRRIRNAALRECSRLLQIEYGICPPGASSCDGEITQVNNFKIQTVAGTNYIMDLTMDFYGREYKCRELTLYESFNCKRASCMESIREESVRLTRKPNPPQPPCAGCASGANINDQPNKRRIKNAALRECSRLLQNQFGICPPGAPSCDGEITKVDNFSIQTVAGTNYIMDLTVDFYGGEYKCRELTLYEPLTCRRASCMESIREESVRLVSIRTVD